MSANRVEVLCPGMIRRDGPVVLEARSTATLVSRGGRRFLVDTSGPENREALLEALEARGVPPGGNEAVVLTHAHGDHAGNLSLFPDAKVIAHRLEGGSLALEGEVELWEGARLVPTPGHTPGSISVVVRAEETYALAGDAIPTEDNVRRWVPPGHHYDRERAMESMALLVGMADVIVPGHGPPFRVEGRKGGGR
ncbi:MAG TPA: MBL fold metallo-hydrolase [Methanomassiliicoccales archaeon]|nr:MBL fold metallo-hydrolase [Methanomassiliicoccales archaeon]